MTSREPRSTCSKVSFSAATFWVLRQSSPASTSSLTLSEVKDTNSLPDSTLLDKVSVTSLSDAVNSQILVCSAICTHLGCIPVPYLGAYKGWVCLCHGSVYDKFGRVRQGPAQANLPYINNSVYGPVVCIEEQIFPNEPSIFLYV